MQSPTENDTVDADADGTLLGFALLGTATATAKKQAWAAEAPVWFAD